MTISSVLMLVILFVAIGILACLPGGQKGDPFVPPTRYSTYRIEWQGVAVVTPYPEQWGRPSAEGVDSPPFEYFAVWYGPPTQESGKWAPPSLTVAVMEINDIGYSGCASYMEGRRSAIERTVAGQRAWVSGGKGETFNEFAGVGKSTGFVACIETSDDQRVVTVESIAAADQQNIAEPVFERVLSGLEISTAIEKPKK